MKHAHSRYMFVLVHDPGEYPLCPGLSMPLPEMILCLRNHAFTPGTVIRDQLAGSEHTVVRIKNSLALDPPSQRIDRYSVIIANINRRSKAKSRAQSRTKGCLAPLSQPWERGRGEGSI